MAVPAIAVLIIMMLQISHWKDIGDVAYYKSNIVQRVSKFLPPLPDYKAGLTKVKVQLDLINYATESDVRIISQHLSKLLTTLDERQI